MAESTPKAPLLGDWDMAKRETKRTFLDDIDALIDWRPITYFLNKKLKRKADTVGNPAYPALAMFKILLLQRWYNLSDPVAEQALYDRLSFIRFSGLSFKGEVPDETTICRFRNGLIKLNEPSVQVSYSDDVDAAWLRKGNRAYYGYKVHLATDARDGFLLAGHATPANRSDTRELPTLIEGVELAAGAYVYADKGYCSGENRDFLNAKGLKDATMDKAPRHGALTAFEKMRNRLISGVRPVVERAFGTFKRGYGFARARYLGCAKVQAELFLVGMAFNLK